MSKGDKMLLEVENIKKKFDRREVLIDINFTLDEGEVKTIIGPSGAGKTTIIRTINGLEELDGGNIIIEGEYLYKELNGKIIKNKDRGIKRKIGLVFQNYNLFPHMTVLENIIESPISILKKDREEVIKKSKDILKKLNLNQKENIYPYQLSGGEQQRVAIARAIILQPKIICLDEPTSALDPENIEEIEIIIRELSSLGIGVLVISHDMVFARKISDEILFLEQGIILDRLNRRDYFENHNSRVRNFIN